MSSSDHKYLLIPGPVEIRPEVSQAQTEWMVGHRSKEFSELFARLQIKLRQVFLTDSRVLLLGASGTGFWEAASRNLIRDDRKVLHLVGGAFSERWVDISRMNGKTADVIEVPWGQGHTPDMVDEALRASEYDAVFLVHNETSTGVMNPLKEIAEVINRYDDTLVVVDTVSGILGSELRVDEWGIDMALTSSQKAFALPPGMAFSSVSDRALERAAQVSNRGYYFDLIELDERLSANNTPTTPPISLMFAADKQLDFILEEGLENRWARHTEMRDITHEWLTSRGFDFFAPEGFRSSTLTSISNTLNIDVSAMEKFMADRGFAMDKGYGKIRGKTFRIAHMGETTPAILKEALAHLDEFIRVTAGSVA